MAPDFSRPSGQAQAREPRLPAVGGAGDIEFSRRLTWAPDLGTGIRIGTVATRRPDWRLLHFAEPAAAVFVSIEQLVRTAIMSLKRVLGTMLASRMAGRGRRRGALGAATMLGLGRRRRGMGGKLGMAALGYMAYRAYQDHQARSGGSTGSGSRGGIGGIIQDVADRITGGGAAPERSAGAQPAAASELQEDERAAAEFSDETALLLIRAMITAAYSDGALSEAERANIMQEIDQAGADVEDRQIMEREIANPKPLDELLRQVDDHETAQEFYLASRAGIDGDAEQNRAYLADLRQRLGLSEEDVQEVEELAP